MKIAIVGAGRVGAAAAFALVTRGVAAEIVLVGRDPRRTEGEALDLSHAAAFVRPTRVTAGELADVAGADLVILTAGAPDRAGDRLAMAGDNAALYRELVPQVARHAPGAILVVVTNPVDVMTYLALQLSGFDRRRVIGTGTLLDTGRFRSALSERWQIHANDVRGYILGEHGDSQFPALSVASAGGVRFDAQDALVKHAADEARQGGDRVFALKGYTSHAVAMAVCMICEAIESDSRAVLPVSTLIDGYLGVRDVCLSVPCVVGGRGVTRVLEVDLDEQEAEAFRRSAGVLRGVIDDVTRDA